ncbi:MAG: hypothetical protein IKE43_06585 [Coriobacteriales bacterium]|nr:hypothetical protein [Coriobacteriales bacterium]
MKVVTFEDIKALGIGPLTCLDWVQTAIARKREALLPPKISLKPFDGVFCNVMPSMLPHDQMGLTGGVKIVTRYPNREPSLESRLLLMNAQTGEFLALMDATWITTMRTGAVAAHSIMLFGKDDFSVIGMMGLGNTARATLNVLAAAMPDRKFTVKLLRYKNQHELFIERFASYKNLAFSVVDTAEDMVKGSHVVVSGATYLPKDICEDRCFDKGVLVVPIHTLGFTNCDLFFDKVFADDTGHVCHFKNYDKFKKFAEVCDVVNGIIPGRESQEERILAYNIGISLHDINFAANIFMMLNHDTLPDIDMHDPIEKFWA